MAYMISANMDQGATDFQLEAAISKVYASVSGPHNLNTCCGASFPGQRALTSSLQMRWVHDKLKAIVFLAWMALAWEFNRSLNITALENSL